MDLHTEHIWLLGNKEQDRSGSAIYSSNEKRDKAYTGIKLALNEWAESYGGRAEHCTIENEPPRFPPVDNRAAWIGSKTGWYVKDYADGWIYFDNRKEAMSEAEAMGGAAIREVNNGVCKQL
jgi:hypothetical protein